MNKKVLALSLVILIIAVSVSVVYVVYSQKLGQRTENTYTIIGTLHYRPGHAIYPGISATNITPTVSPEPSTRTFTEDNGSNTTVTSFVYLRFPSTFKFPPNFTMGFPSGFEQNENVTVSGQMSYEDFYHGYVMNVTSISPISS
jgi:hypothetical protein